MQARRLPDAVGGGCAERFSPGDYQLGEDGHALWVCLPNGAFGRLPNNAELGWTWTVDEDGSVTVSPSINDTAGLWHGFLRHGQWIEEW